MVKKSLAKIARSRARSVQLVKQNKRHIFYAALLTSVIILVAWGMKFRAQPARGASSVSSSIVYCGGVACGNHYVVTVVPTCTFDSGYNGCSASDTASLPSIDSSASVFTTAITGYITPGECPSSVSTLIPAYYLTVNANLMGTTFQVGGETGACFYGSCSEPVTNTNASNQIPFTFSMAPPSRAGLQNSGSISVNGNASGCSARSGSSVTPVPAGSSAEAQYSITACNSGYTATADNTCVSSCKINSFTCDGSATLVWSTASCSSQSISPTVGSVGSSGSTTATVGNTYTLTADSNTSTITCPSPSLSSTWKDSGTSSQTETVTPGTTITIPFNFFNTGQSGSVISGIKCTAPSVIGIDVGSVVFTQRCNPATLTLP